MTTKRKRKREVLQVYRLYIPDDKAPLDAVDFLCTSAEPHYMSFFPSLTPDLCAQAKVRRQVLQQNHFRFLSGRQKWTQEPLI